MPQGYRSGSFLAGADERANSAAFSKIRRTPMPVPLVNSIPRRSSSPTILSILSGLGMSSSVSNLRKVRSEMPEARANSGRVILSSSLAAFT